MKKKVQLLSAYSLDAMNFGPAWLQTNSRPLEGYELVDDSELADFIIFVEAHPGWDPYYFQVKAHQVYKRYKQKCILYHDADRCVNRMRVITPNIEKWQYEPKRHAASHFLALQFENQFVDRIHEFDQTRRYLFSFDGSTRTNPLRKRLMSLDHPRSLLIDRGQSRAWEMTSEEREQYQRDYVEGIAASQFILCPAGVGSASARLFETMCMGRPPVILSDQWLPVGGLDWDTFSVIIKEADVPRIGEILESREAEAEQMGQLARKAWEANFSPEVSLQRLCEMAERLLQHPYRVSAYLWDNLQFFHPYHFRGLLRYYTKFRRSVPKIESTLS
ncbi:MAG: exostosin family protein [Verrucomicrobiota bacterium]